MPDRVQRQRTKGWRKPEGAVYVGRGSDWGNPWRVGEPSPWAPYEPMDHAGVVAVFRYGIDTEAGRAIVRRELVGRDLMCWCLLVDADGKPVPCHADVLLELANPDAPGGAEDA